MEHETAHLPNTQCNRCGLYDSDLVPGVDEVEEECQKRTRTVDQLKQLKGKLDLECEKVAQAVIKAVDEWVSRNCENGHKKGGKP